MPTAWDEMWREGRTPWDKGSPAPPLIDYLEERGGWIDGRSILVPGCGSGHDVRELARQGARSLGLDLSPTAIARARELAPVNGSEFAVGDFFEHQGPAFDGLWEHTCFCAINPERRGAYAASAARLVRPGGRLFGVFYLKPWDDDETPEPPPFGASRDEITECLSGFDLVWDRVPNRSYEGREGREWLAEFVRRDP